MSADYLEEPFVAVCFNCRRSEVRDDRRDALAFMHEHRTVVLSPWRNLEARRR